MRIEAIMNSAAKVWNLDDITTRCRRPAYIWARAFAVKEMRSVGMTYGRIGEILGLNHASCIYLAGKMEDAATYPAAFADVLDKYDIFKAILNNYDLHERPDGSALAVRRAFHHCRPGAVVPIPGSRCIAQNSPNLHIGNRRPQAAQFVLRGVRPAPHA